MPAPRLPRPRARAALDPDTTARFLRKTCPIRPTLAAILGSGFEAALSQFKVLWKIPFARLPGFPRPSVPGHAGQVVATRWHNTPLLVLAGRGHFYEGFSMEEITFPVRVLACFGIRNLLLTNAAGGIHRRLRPGDFMLVTDHINGMGTNPLRGQSPAGLNRFVDLSETYDTALCDLLRRAARECGLPLREGVYLAVSGPSYETPAEIRAFARLGADAVGMSTVPEAVVARQHGLAVAALSCITNLAAGRQKGSLLHEEVLQVGQQAAHRAQRLFTAFAKLYGRGTLETPPKPPKKKCGTGKNLV